MPHIFRILEVIFLTALTTQLVNANEVQSTSTDIKGAIGKDICSLKEDWLDKFGVYIDTREKYAVSYRSTKDQKLFFLLVESKGSTKYCGNILDILDVTVNMEEGTGVEYKCNERGKKAIHWGNIFGLSKEGIKSGRFIKPIRAWIVNSKTWKIEPISNKKIVCDTSGFSD